MLKSLSLSSFAVKLPVALFATLLAVSLLQFSQAQEEEPKVEAEAGPILERIKAAIPGLVPDGKTEKKGEKEEPAVDVPRVATVKHSPRYLKMHLFDGSVLTGDLSIAEITPRALHALATAAMSTHRSVGLIGDSNHTSFVLAEKIVSGRASSSSETKRGLMPNFGSKSASR